MDQETLAFNNFDVVTCFSLALSVIGSCFGTQYHLAPFDQKPGVNGAFDTKYHNILEKDFKKEDFPDLSQVSPSGFQGVGSDGDWPVNFIRLKKINQLKQEICICISIYTMYINVFGT